MGPVPGLIGCLQVLHGCSHTIARCDTTSFQAMEAIKVLGKLPGVFSGKICLYDGTDGSFRWDLAPVSVHPRLTLIFIRYRTFKLKSKGKNCAVCGDSPTIQNLHQRFVI